MPVIGDMAEVVFNAPPLKENMKRSVFLKSAGYYRIHLPEAAENKIAELNRMTIVPGEIVKYSMDAYVKWQKDLRRGGVR
jgi:hypothetical protein